MRTEPYDKQKNKTKKRIRTRKFSRADSFGLSHGGLKF
jgi:hypothetical protein